MSSARTYRLGIDLGTTYTAAVVCRRPGGSESAWSEPEIVALGSQSASVASVLYLGSDEQGGTTVLVGEAAERRGLTEPDRVVRQFKRRIGDDVPLVVGDAVHTAHELAARLGRWVVDKVAEREGGPADAVAVTHPAAWGDHKKDLLAGALRSVGLDDVTFLPEPQAAAVAYSARERVDAGGSVAVYDLGGGTFDAAVVRRTEQGFDLPGRAEGIEQLGGVDFDDRVFDHVRAGIGASLDALDFEDPDVVSAVLRLRRECVEAKEALSFDTQVTIPVMLPDVRTNVRLTRVEFEAAIRSSVDHTVDALRRSVESASLTPDDLQAVLLVGGSSRIPLVAQMISAELGRPVAVDSDPKTSIAMGAALAIAPRPAAAAPASANGRAGAATSPATPTSPPPAPALSSATTPSASATERDASSSGVLDLRALAEQDGGAAARPTETRAPAAYAEQPAPPRPAYGDAPAPGRPPVGSRPAEPVPGRSEGTAFPPRPEVSSRTQASTPPEAAGAGSWVDVPEGGSRNIVRTVIIIAIVALVLFGGAFGVGLYIKANRQQTTQPTAPSQTGRSASPDPALLFRNPPAPV